MREEMLVESVIPFVPNDPTRLKEHCYEAYNIQVQGLTTRLKAAKINRVVIGVSGGLDSSQATIVAARAMDALGLSRNNVLAYTRPALQRPKPPKRTLCR